MFTRAQLSPVPGAGGAGGAGKRCDSALSNRSTAAPSRPCSSLASRGPSRGSPSGAGPSTSALGGNIWREDAKWPVREGGLCSLPGTNGSLDLDLDLARRKLVEEVNPEIQARKFADEILRSVEKTHSVAGSQDSASAPGRRHALYQAVVLSEPPSPLVRGDATDPAVRERVMKWSFMVTKEEIKDRLDLLDQSFYDHDYREAVFIRREEDAVEDSLLERLLQYYVSSGIKSWGQSTHPANLDFWLAQEGGVARTCELLLALEVLNFYRWICRLGRFEIDSFLQGMADLFIQAIQKRSDRPLCKATEDHQGLAAAIEQFVEREGCRLAIVTHVPAAVDAARQLFYGLPFTATSDGGPQVLTGQTDVSLPVKGEVSLEPYLPLFRLTDEGTSERKAPRTEETQETQETQEIEDIGDLNVTRSREERLLGIRKVPVPDGPPAALPRPPGVRRYAGEGFKFTMNKWWNGLSTGGRSRISPCWGDLRGVASFRRSLLDPSVYGIGLLRRGCNFCVVCPSDEFDGQPPEDIHEEPPPEDDFLDPDLETKDSTMETEVKATIGKEYAALLKWRQAEPWKKMVKTRATKKVGILHEKLTSLDESVDLDGMDGWPVLSGTFMEKDHPDPIPYARRTQDNLDAQMRTEHVLRREGKLVESNAAKTRFEHFVEEEDLAEPIMVCFPPPGIVPVEILCEAEMMPWTISPDPYRLSPTSDCRVDVYRVRLDIEAGTAERLSEVSLCNFCVDSTTSLGFCVIFTPNLRLKPGDNFEVVLSGLRDQETPKGAVCSLQYFLSFNSFARHNQDLGTLARRAASWQQKLSTPSIWEEVQFTSGHEGSDRAVDERLGSAKRVRTNTTIAKGGMKSSLKSQIMDGALEEVKEKNPKTGRLVQLRFEEVKTAPTSFDQKRPPPIGVVRHPKGERTRQGYHLEVTRNEVMLSLVHPSSVTIKANLSCFLKSQAKWEGISHGVWQMCFDEPSMETTRDLSEGPEARHKRQTRVVLTVMLPTLGQYELRFQWGMVPLTSTDAGLCRMVNCGVAQMDHPLRISLRCHRPDPDFKHLVPSLLHTSMQRYGFPVKHPLAEQFGMTLLQPLRHRLRSGQEIRFLVYSTQADVDSSHLRKLAAETGAGSERVNRRGSHVKEVISEDGAKKPTSEELRHRIRSALKLCMRCGSAKGPARIVVVIGNWQRVQVLSRRLLSTDVSARAEVHEGLVRLTSEDKAQTLQLIVFQVASDKVLDQLLADRVKKAKDKEPFVRKDIPFEGAPVLGSTPRPNYWVLAEFQVDSSSTPLPYDEEEMLKPPPPPPDAIELIRNLEVGRSVKLDHQGDDKEEKEEIARSASNASTTTATR